MYLTIQINNNCDLSCTFCVQGGDVSRGGILDNTSTHVLPQDALRKSLDEIDQTIDEINIMGGEPLLTFETLVETVKTIRANPHQKEQTLWVLTNGLGLNQRVLGWAHENNIGFAVAIDGIEKSQRSLDQLVQKSAVGSEIIRIIQDLPHVSIRRVITNGFAPFAASVWGLRKMFPHVEEFTIDWDRYKMPELNIQHLHHATRQFLILRDLDPDWTDWLSIMSFWKGPDGFTCNCAGNYYLTNNGDLNTLLDHPNFMPGFSPKETETEPFNGCVKISNLMGRDNFETWRSQLRAITGAAAADTALTRNAS